VFEWEEDFWLILLDQGTIKAATCFKFCIECSGTKEMVLLFNVQGLDTRIDAMAKCLPFLAG